MPRASLFARQLRSSESGTIAIIFALCITGILGSVAVAIDFVRYQNVRTKLWNGLDRASLAGAKLLNDDTKSNSEVEDRTRSYYLSQATILGIPVETNAPLTVTIDRPNNSVTAQAYIDLKMSFASVIGLNTMRVSQAVTASYKLKKIEIAMALDVTGSMSSVPAGDTVTKVDAMKTAAKSVVDTMYDLAPNDIAVRIALAPYSAAVNIAPYNSAVTGTSGWGNDCVIERLGSENATDADSSGSAMLRPLAAPDADTSWSTCPTASIMPLLGRSQRNYVKSEIDSFSPSGGTAGHLGTAWAWYLVSNKWASLFPSASKPLADAPDVIKNVVIMTDGNFNVAYLSGPATSSNTATSQTDSYSQFRDLCANMKTAQVNIYTVGFGLGAPGSTAETELRSCASSAVNFFSAANSTELLTAFSAIADRISQLRIAK